MTTSISDGTDTFTATLMDGYTASRPSRNVPHAILGSNAPAVSLRPAGLRTGSLRLLFALHATAVSATALLASGAELTLDDTDFPTINMSFVLDGDVELSLDEDTRSVWWVQFEFQEVD